MKSDLDSDSVNYKKKKSIWILIRQLEEGKTDSDSDSVILQKTEIGVIRIRFYRGSMIRIRIRIR